MDNRVLWRPSERRASASTMHGFMLANGFANWNELLDWSIRDRESFWAAVVDYLEVRLDTPPAAVLEQSGDMSTARWFRGARLNFAANLLRHSGDRPAIVFRGEDGSRRELSFDELRTAVAGAAEGLRRAGVTAGDRVAGILPNCPEAAVSMLAAASVGAVWSSCSPDFGSNGIVDRFGQIEPKVLIAADGYAYGGKRFDLADTIAGVMDRVAQITQLVIVPFIEPETTITGAMRWDSFVVDGVPLSFVSLPFDHPLYVMFSSGTTGKPKCLVHGAGGTLLKHVVEHALHCDVREGDRLFYFTTCGWMMWNWLISGLASGATLILFDGAPFHDDGRVLWRIAEEERISIFGTSAKYISALEKSGMAPGREFDLSSVRTILSTGSPLAPASFDYVYEYIRDDVLLASISGGTDIIGCFAGGNPLLPVRRGELQSVSLGMAVEIYDDTGRAVTGESGELVCTKAFPSMPVSFWGDEDGELYRSAYFSRFPGVWAHGDYAELSSHGGMIIHGRSDAVLNPGGVRIGTAEIYRQVEKVDEVLESIAIGQDWDNDVRVVLFVVLREDIVLDDDLRLRISSMIRKNTTPRHVPAKILQVPEIPRTISGKIVEIAVRSVVHGEAVRNTDALANPDALRYFRDRQELAS